MLTKFSVEHDFHTGVFIAVLAALIVYVWLYLMKSGFLVRVVGENQRFAQVAKVPVSRVQLGAIAISGSLCGLAGGIEYTSLAGTLSTSFSQNWGFLALPTALLGGLHPIGAAASSLFFGALIAGTDNLARFGKGDGSIVFVVQAVSVLAFLAIQRISKRGAKT
jgi:simple sugar transport system permease protein